MTQENIDVGAATTNTFTFAPSNATSKGVSNTVAITLNPKLDITKTATHANGDPIPSSGTTVGDLVIHFYQITNNGNVTYINVNLSDNHAGKG